LRWPMTKTSLILFFVAADVSRLKFLSLGEVGGK
jgi:hypothetical protein